MLSDALVRQTLGPGLSVVVGTADARGTPSCCRAVGLVVDASAQGVTVYLPVMTSAAVIADIATTGRVAIVSSNPVDHSTVQIKGCRRLVRVAGAEDLPVVRDLLDRLADTLETVGLSKRLSRSLAHWPAFAVEVDVDTVFDQTPGPRAGNLVKGK